MHQQFDHSDSNGSKETDPFRILSKLSSFKIFQLMVLYVVIFSFSVELEPFNILAENGHKWQPVLLSKFHFVIKAVFISKWKNAKEIVTNKWPFNAVAC